MSSEFSFAAAEEKIASISPMESLLISSSYSESSLLFSFSLLFIASVLRPRCFSRRFPRSIFPKNDDVVVANNNRKRRKKKKKKRENEDDDDARFEERALVAANEDKNDRDDDIESERSERKVRFNSQGNSRKA